MKPYDHFLKLTVVVGLIISGAFLTVLFSGAALIFSGISIEELSDISKKGMDELSTGSIRALLAIQHICIFILPAVVFGLITYRSNIWMGLDLSRLPTLALAFLGVIFLLGAYPLVNLSYLLNESVSLPAWAGEFEEQANDTLKKILQMDTPLIFFFNLVLIAVLPGIGEELLFRGLIQKHLGGWIRSPVTAIWISAFIFSLIHMQFEGFLPRIVLGATLGYLYYWTNNLWVPIITHAFNNGIQVILIYTMGMDIEDIDQQGSETLSWWMILLSVVAMYFIYTLIIKNRPAID